MSLEFEWDEKKARTNRKKHRVAFEEASTVFGDPFALTIDDPLHSEEEERFVTLGESEGRRLVVVAFTEPATRSGLSGSGWQPGAKGSSMKKVPKRQRDPDMLDEYDFSKGVRGKYARRFADGSNVIVLSPDVAPFFPDSKAVNDALRALVAVARKTAKGSSR